MEVAARQDATKQRLASDEALALARQASVIIVAKGKKVVRIDMKKDAPSDDDLRAVLLGPTGSLRAPTLRKGKTLLVGFDPDAYAQVLRGL